MIVVPTIHPAALLRDQTMQFCVVQDLGKLVRIARDGGPTLLPAYMREGDEAAIQRACFPRHPDVPAWFAAHDHHTLSVDIESTYHDDIVCIGYWCAEPECVWSTTGICVPHLQQGGKWYTFEGEASDSIANIVRRVLEDATWPKIGQNFVGFDAPLLARKWRLIVRGVIGDTMIAHSLVMAELPHSLAFQASLVTDLGAYKLEVHEQKEEAAHVEDDDDEPAADDDQKDDAVKTFARVLDYDDRQLREYCLLDCFSAAVSWLDLAPAMEAA